MGETCACTQRTEPAFPFAVRLLCGRQGTLQQAVASNLLPNSHCHARFAGAENRDQLGVQLGMLGGTASMDARFCLSNFFWLLLHLPNTSAVVVALNTVPGPKG